MKDEYMSSAEIKEKIAELKIRLAFQLEFEEELNQAMAECETSDPDMIRLVRESEADILNQIAEHSRRARSAQVGKRTWARAGKVAAMIAVALTISFGSALATIRMVETGVLKLDIQQYEGRTSYGLIETGIAIDVPAEWEGEFYPSYIPEGYFFSHIDRIGLYYINSDNNEICFSEYDQGVRRSVDTEDAGICNVVINGADAMVVEKNGLTTVIWSANNRCFMVEIQGDKDTALQIAASVVLIK